MNTQRGILFFGSIMMIKFDYAWEVNSDSDSPAGTLCWKNATLRWGRRQGLWRWDSFLSYVVCVLSLFIRGVGAVLVRPRWRAVTTWGHGSSGVDAPWRWGWRGHQRDILKNYSLLYKPESRLEMFCYWPQRWWILEYIYTSFLSFHLVLILYKTLRFTRQHYIRLPFLQMQSFLGKY